MESITAQFQVTTDAAQPVQMEIEMRHKGHLERGRNFERARKFARAFVWTDWADEMSTSAICDAAKSAGSIVTLETHPFAAPEYIGAADIHTKRGAFPAVDKAWDKHNREIVRRKSIVFREGLKAVLKEKHNDVKFRFSRTAGCSCGCSPGFIVEGVDARITFYVQEPKVAAPAVVEDKSTACSTL